MCMLDSEQIGENMQKSDQKRMKIIGMGVYIPEKVLTNADLEKMVETSDEWIVSGRGSGSGTSPGRTRRHRTWASRPPGPP